MTTTAELVEKLRAADPTGAMPVFVRPYEQPGADGSFLYDIPPPVRGFARRYIDTPEPCLPGAEGAFPCVWLEA
jgi:hypothetical protein